MMPLYVKVGRLWRNTQSPDTILGIQVFLFVIRILCLQLVDFGTHLTTQMVYGLLGFHYVKVARVYYTIEVLQRKAVMIPCAVCPHRPDEQREDCFRILTQIICEIEDTMIVQRYCHTDIMQRRGIALQVFDGIGIGVEHIRTLKHRLRLRGNALKQIVEIGINTSYHVRADTFAHKIHQNRLLPSFQLFM